MRSVFAALRNSSLAAPHESMKRRIDLVLVERGFAESRHKAQALLLAGYVLVKEQKVEKPGLLVDSDADIRVLHQLKYASRAGAKLKAALDAFRIDVKGCVCADLGASTGGFTDCLLQQGAAAVHAFDVGKGQLAWKLQCDPSVIVHDEYNVRNIVAADLPESLSLVCMDLSFISVTKILEPLKAALDGIKIEEDHRTIDIVVLVKPQFEAGKGEIGKGGIVRDEATRLRTLRMVKEFASKAGYCILGDIPSPLPGAEGNLEFLLHLQWLKR
jgi:23S rRNA (cytidine1920-2'-O)/16S rRNA (cytidine1409-2'-O)-methyltransferase